MEEFGTWGGPPGPRPTPTSASVSGVMEKPDQGVRRGRGRPPHCALCGELLTHDTSRLLKNGDWLRRPKPRDHAESTSSSPTGAWTALPVTVFQLPPPSCENRLLGRGRMDLDTSIGGNQARFPETRRSAIVDLRSEDPARLAAASETLIAGYWKPVYKYLRVRWNQSNEDAKDLTQAFFTRVLEKQFFNSYDPAKARFRTYLRSCLDAFLSNESKAASRIKRGGAARFVSLDFETAEGEIRQYDAASAEQSPEEYFQREWVRHLFSLALDDLRRECHEGGKQLLFRVFERYDLNDDGEKPTYETLAREFGITATAATNYLASMRRRLRHFVLERIRETTAAGKDFRSEVRLVLGIEV